MSIDLKTETIKVAYRTTKIEEIAIFYREAKPKDAPVVLLLQGRALWNSCSPSSVSEVVMISRES